MTYQPPQNILAAILQQRKQQGAAQMNAQTPNVDMSQPANIQMPAPQVDQGSGQGGGILGFASKMAGYDPNTLFGYQAPQGGGALGMLSQMAGLPPATGQTPPPQQSNGIMSLLSSLFGGK